MPESRLRSSVLPLVLVVVMLIGSVVVPARQTWRVMRLLREMAEVIEPARLLEARLEIALTRDATALNAYLASGGRVVSNQYEAALRDEARQLAALDSVARRLDTEAIARVAFARRHIEEWQRVGATLFTGRAASATAMDSTLRAREAAYDAVLGAVDSLSAYLADESAARRDRIRAAERISLVVNTLLVLVALAALVAVAGLGRRERRLSATLQRRVTEEATLREAAETLAAAFTVEDVLRQITQSALNVTRARGAMIEQVQPATVKAPQAIVVRASAGTGVPTAGTQAMYGGSYTAFVLEGGKPVVVQDLTTADHTCTATETAAPGWAALALPLGAGQARAGVLFLLGESGFAQRQSDLDRAQTFANLASLAYEKARLLEDAHRSSRELERVMNSRSRLMRGFSHDIKNPLVAADGHASLLSDGIYGELTTRQHEGISHIRRCILSAFALIDYLHELARTEAGHIALTLDVVDVADLARTLVEDYRASAAARGLSIEADTPDGPVFAKTDRTRVRQVLGNLVSNAIKYTAHGSVSLRVRRAPANPTGDGGDWACIDVTDTGSGIPAEKREAIFEEFTRLAANETAGAGLGLAISQRLTEALGGKILVESEVGRGSTFTLLLPAPGASRAETTAGA